MKKWKIDRIIRIATLLSIIVVIVLVLKKPAPVAPPQAPAAAAANAQSFQDKMAQLEQVPPRSADTTETGEAAPSSTPPTEVRISSDEVNAALAQAAGSVSGTAPLSPNSELGTGTPTIKDQRVSFEGDTVHGQFLVTVAGKDVWLTLSGHLGAKDGYATFEPTEIKLGDMNVPVSLVNGVLQKKLAEQRGQMKLPDSVGGMKIENGELVLQPK